MDYQRESNGLVTFLEHWWFLLVAVVALLVSQLLTFYFVKIPRQSALFSKVNLFRSLRYIFLPTKY